MSLIDVSSAAGDREGGVGQSASVFPMRLAAKPVNVLRPDFGPASWTDRQLVFAAGEFRDAAFAELFRRHAKSVAAVARMVLGTANPGCDDVVAEVFGALWFAPEKFDSDRGSLLGFLRLRARGLSIDVLRCEASRRRREQRAESARTRIPAVEEQVTAADIGDALRHAVSRLPESERTAIELAYFHGMTYRAVASHLELPEGTVKSRIRSGLQRLRARVDAEACPRVGTVTGATCIPRRRPGTRALE